ncbi:MAG: ComF family protein, partial [Bacteroidales bacterium]|nr:ComF family protein [Bacteroidales bacterium]
EMADLIAEKLEGKYDLITFVPVSRLRRFTRGYDQSKLLAEAVGRELDRPVARCVRKIRNTRRQSRLHSAAERKANVQNAYRAWRPQDWAGKRLLLIDDVLTTGATVSEVSRVLLTNGAAEVSCCFLAVTPKQQR